jgi:hypothetical protein
MAMTLKIIVLWFVTSCNLVDIEDVSEERSVSILKVTR